MIRFKLLTPVSFALLGFIACLPATASAQRGADPVHWTYSVKPAANNTRELHILATIDQGWHIYAQVQPPEAISVPTRITISSNPLIKPDGKPKEIGEKETYTDPTAGIKQYQYGNKVEFVQLLTLRSKARLALNGTITYQACTGEQCLPPKTISFSIEVE